MPKKAISFPPNFPQELLTSLPRRRRLLFGTPADDRQWTEEFLRRLRVLKKHYGIKDEPGTISILTLHLLTDLVPGFQEAASSRAGRPIDVKLFDERQRLLSEVESRQTRNPHLSDLRACENVKKESGREFRDKSVEALRKDVRLARREREAQKTSLVSKFNELLGSQEGR